MIKIILILCTLIILTTACVEETSYVDAKLIIDKITYREDDTSWFSFYIDKTAELETKYIYVSSLNDKNPESGSLCDNARSPHICNIDFKYPSYLIKITYTNLSVSITEIAVPKPEPIDEPTIMSPKEKPEQNSSFEMSFKDVGANSYEVRIANCNEYNNDGINPCLDSQEYKISVENGNATTENALVEIKDGLINLKSDFIINFEDAVQYDVTAIKSSDKSYTENNYSLSYYKE